MYFWGNHFIDNKLIMPIVPDDDAQNPGRPIAEWDNWRKFA